MAKIDYQLEYPTEFDREIDFNEYTTDQIRSMIKKGLITNETVVHYYNNDQWEDEVE